MFATEAPNTLRIPISLIRRSVAKAAKAKSPKQAMKMASPAKMKTTPANRSSLL